MSFINSRCAHEIFYNTNNLITPLNFLQTVEMNLNSFLSTVFEDSYKKFQLHLKLAFIKHTLFDEEDVHKIVYIATNYITLRYYGDISFKINEAFSEILERLENLEMEGSGFTIDDIDFLDCHVLRIDNNILAF